jgi:threonine dehydratase
MPVTTPKQKLEQVEMFGGNFAEIKLVGDTFDASKNAALDLQKLRERLLFILLMMFRLLKDRQLWHWKF